MLFNFLVHRQPKHSDLNNDTHRLPLIVHLAINTCCFLFLKTKKKNEAEQTIHELQNVRKDLEDAKHWKTRCEQANSKLAELEQTIAELREEISRQQQNNKEIKNKAEADISEKNKVSFVIYEVLHDA